MQKVNLIAELMRYFDLRNLGMLRKRALRVNSFFSFCFYIL